MVKTLAESSYGFQTIGNDLARNTSFWKVRHEIFQGPAQPTRRGPHVVHSVRRAPVKRPATQLTHLFEAPVKHQLYAGLGWSIAIYGRDLLGLRHLTKLLLPGFCPAYAEFELALKGLLKEIALSVGLLKLILTIQSAVYLDVHVVFFPGAFQIANPTIMPPIQSVGYA